MLDMLNSLEVSTGLVLINNLPRESKNGATNVVGIFKCQRCRKTWRSGKICVVVRVRAPDQFHPLVYSQKCNRCGRNGIADLDRNVFIARVGYLAMRLLGRDVAAPFEGPRKKKKSTPHEKVRCSACIANIAHT